MRIYDSQPASSLEEVLTRILAQARPGDYVALMAYLTEQSATDNALSRLRTHLRDALGVATTVGYGPRFLHSTGQLHKGGPNAGLFVQFTASAEQDVAIPDAAYSFGMMRQAQADGDLRALRAHGGRVIRIDLGKDVSLGLKQVIRASEAALSLAATDKS